MRRFPCLQRRIIWHNMAWQLRGMKRPQNYGTYDIDNSTYQIWLENAKSLEAKLQVMSAYQLGGIAEWKLGLETPDVWTLIENYVKNEAAIDPVIPDETAAVQNTENTGEQTDTADEQAPLEEIVTE